MGRRAIHSLLHLMKMFCLFSAGACLQMTAGQSIVRQNHNSRVLEDPRGLSGHSSSLFVGQKLRRKDKTTKGNVLWAVWGIHRGKVNPPPANGEPNSPSSSVPHSGGSKREVADFLSHPHSPALQATSRWYFSGPH